MKNQMRLAKGDLMKCQMACHKFDNESNKKPFKDWFWPKFDVNDQESDDCETEEEEEKEEETIMEKLILINDYLRKEYCYCVWCGVKFDSDEDMQDECPGNDRYSHF